MLRIKIVVVDRTRRPFLKEGESFYIERIRRYASLEWVEARPAKITKGRPEGEVLAEEALNIERRIAKGDYTVALERTGKSLTSEGMAYWIKGFQKKGVECVAFLIGGPLGLSEETSAACRERLSLSALTLTHEMSRLVLLEQIYRAFTILKGEKYHK
jgi:23S rRNA (pseudouridine1915-N3)-methyltransferase